MREFLESRRPLIELVSSLTSGATPASGSSRYYVDNGGLPFAKIDDLTATSGRELIDTVLHVNDKALRETALKVYPTGTVLLSMYGTIGLTKVAGQPLTANQAIAALIPPFKCDAEYLYHFLTWARPQWEKYQGQTTQANINGRTVGNFPVGLPARAEQRRIANTLDSIDDEIRSTADQIKKGEMALQALAATLLTSGTAEVGATQGELPQGWKYAPLAAMRSDTRPYLKTGPFGSSLKQEHWVDEGVPVVTIGSLGDGVFLESELLYISDRTASGLSSYALEPGDVVFSRVADVGRSVVVEDVNRGWIMSSNMMWISLDQRLADPRFVRASIALNPVVRTQIRRLVNSSGRDVANAAILNRLEFSWPPFQEQVHIADIIDAQYRRIAILRSKKAKQLEIKSGVMSDLMTGRVRVPPGAAS
jgi:type I restriction enzyme S subunit